MVAALEAVLPEDVADAHYEGSDDEGVGVWGRVVHYCQLILRMRDLRVFSNLPALAFPSPIHPVACLGDGGPLDHEDPIVLHHLWDGRGVVLDREAHHVRVHGALDEVAHGSGGDGCGEDNLANLWEVGLDLVDDEVGVQEGLAGVLDGPGSGLDGLGEACVDLVLGVEHVRGTVDGLGIENRGANCVGVHLTPHPHEGLVGGCGRPTVQAAGAWEDWRNAENWIAQHWKSWVDWLVHYHYYYCYYY